ncbi:MAG: hypothetical protein K9J16_06125 [Melioribacteraceae bacterium]|nr:hypothetical protein [Melioribacteraceae bacterium]MCF8354180.1 hypothetical protein [Melioribacteraceae bacterium]MCF8394718.1 hypothetical protein [Melioribacteraceae bacterium]MCF8418103.1 hypothetical protein [Melioribacteraceae bacterium]
MNLKFNTSILVFLFSLSTVCSSQQEFKNQNDIGKISLHGKFDFNESNNTYTLTGSGENIWETEDAFYFVWSEMNGDITLASNIELIGEGNHVHRKAGLMIRGGIEADDPYVDVVVHGDGLTSMQYRKIKGGGTFEIQAPVKYPKRIRLERTGNQFTFYYSTDDNTMHPGGTISVELGNQYAGLAICSHDSTTYETAVFSNVFVDSKMLSEGTERVLESTLEIINVETGIRRIVRRAKEHFEAPNWKGDDNTLIYNMDGKLYSIPVDGGETKEIFTSFATRCNNDHGLSPDLKQLAISHHQGDDWKSFIYVVPVTGGEPRLVTENGPSYWHGWSPDGSTLVYCAERNGEFDVYAIPVEGGNEIRLTDAPGLDDGPEYSPDGKFIYFNSVRTGQMKIWRMNADGSDEVQISPDDNYGDWFAHPSPDNTKLVFVSYDKSVEGHPANKDVVLRIMPVEKGEPEILAVLFGGQGTINVPSWSPDSKKAAFVSYRLVIP